MAMQQTIKMGNDEFILHIRKNNSLCKTDNKVLGQKIWKWILAKDSNAKEIKNDVPCLWGTNTPNTNPEILPKTATQFEFQRSLLPQLYSFLETL